MSNGFCCYTSAEMREAEEIDKLIERKLKKNFQKTSQEYKLLLLGCGESGKSTFIKQMKIIHGSGYSDNEAKNFILSINRNIITAISVICKIIESKYENEDSDDESTTQKPLPNYYQSFVEIQDIDDSSLVQYKDVLIEAWDDPEYKNCFKNTGHFHLQDSAEYFLNPKNLERIFSPNYVPINDDIVRSRVATTGVFEFNCSIKKTNFRLIDVGGQRSERKKWIHCFENVTSIIFLASLSEYDQYLVEASHILRTHESLSLFSNILRYNCFAKTSIILFLNKYDLLQEKIKTIHIKNYLTDYTGPDCDFEAAKQYFSDKYNACNTDKSRIIYGHFTCATDTENIKFVFEAVKDTILQNHLQEYSLV